METYKTLGLALVASTGFIVNADGASSVKEASSWSKSYPVTTESPQLDISNIWGDVTVRPGSNDTIVVSVTEVRSAPDRKLFERSLEVLKLNIDTSSDRVSMRVGDPERRWNRSNPCQGCRVDYQFSIEVPAKSMIDVSTVNDGKIDVEGVIGNVDASNVNGPVLISKMSNCDKINTVNGPITVSYEAAPTSDCTFNTINGDVNLTMPDTTNLNVSVDLFNGKVSSELPVEPLALPASVEKTRKDGRTKFHIKKQSGFSIGSGGPAYSIASMNGDVRIRKAQ